MNSDTEQMKRFGEVNWYDGGSTYCQTGEGIDAGIYDGKLKVSVDCYTLLDESGGKDFDVDAWEAQTIWIGQGEGQSVRAAWYQLFRAARALKKGMEVLFKDGSCLSMRGHVAAVSNLTEVRS